MADPRIVLFDLETLPNLFEAIKVWPQLSNYPGITLRASISSIICAGWKALGKDEPVHCINAWDYPSWFENMVLEFEGIRADCLFPNVNDDLELCKAISESLTSADCVITHNGKKFDWKFLQTRLRYHKLPPLPPIHHVDTCAEARRELFIFNNRLQTIARYLTTMEKRDHEGWDLWVKVWMRNKPSQEEMSLYCKQDVTVLEAVFNELKPVIKGLPNHNLFSPFKEKVCPQCGSSRIKSEGKRYTSTQAYRRYCCQDCKKWFRTDLGDELPRSI